MTNIYRDVGLGEDPGWRPKPGDSLTSLRFLFVAFCMAILGMGIVAAFILRDEAASDAPAWQSIAVITAFGCASLAAQAFLPRPLDGSAITSLAASYRARFFLRLAMSEAVALAAFALSIAWGPWWAFYVGAAFTLTGFARLAPTRRHLQQDQDQLSLAGCDLSLTEALRTPAS